LTAFGEAKTGERLIHLKILDVALARKWTKMERKWCGNGFCRGFVQSAQATFASVNNTAATSRVAVLLSWDLHRQLQQHRRHQESDGLAVFTGSTVPL
jgi:hypothetical protein